MKRSVTLFQFKTENIKIHITASFENEDLVVEGYDIGKVVEESWGDSDYEYSVTVRKADIPKLCQELEISSSDPMEILQHIAKRFNGNHSYSAFRDFLEEHDIEHEGFSWA